MELEVWKVWDRDGAVARALAPYAERHPPIPGGDARRLRESGLRAVLLPESELDTIRSSLDTIGPRISQSIAPAALWTTVAEGPAWRGAKSLQLADGPIILRGGSLGLLLRAWTAPASNPALDASARIRADLAVRHLSDSGPGPGAARAGTAFERGRVLESLSVSATLSRGEALVLCGASPLEDWSALREEEADRTQGDADPDEDPDEEAGGPSAPLSAGTSVGEALLTDAATPNPRGVRTLIVLIARPPERYRLLGP